MLAIEIDVWILVRRQEGKRMSTEVVSGPLAKFYKKWLHRDGRRISRHI